jgi:hypothetical protein
MLEKSSNPEKIPQSVNSKIANLDNWIQDNLKGGRFRYSRVQIPENYPWQENEDGSVTVNATPFAKLGEDAAERYENHEDIVGTCREIAPSAAKILEAKGLLTNTRVLACTNNGELHYSVAGDIEDSETGEKVSVVIDLGYSQPIPVSVPVGKGPKVSDFYNGEKGPGQIYQGKTSYEAVESGDGITVTISSDSGQQVKKFEFKPAESVDEEIVKGFASVTGSMAETRIDSSGGNNRLVRENHDNNNRFHELHDLIKRTNAQVKVVFKG